MELTLVEIVFMFDLKYNKLFSQLYQIPHGKYGITEFKNILSPSITNIVKQIRLKLDLTVQCDENELIKFDKKIFFISDIRIHR